MDLPAVQTGVAEVVGTIDLRELALDDAPQLGLALEDVLDAFGFGRFLLELGPDQVDLEFCYENFHEIYSNKYKYCDPHGLNKYW